MGAAPHSSSGDRSPRRQAAPSQSQPRNYSLVPIGVARAETPFPDRSKLFPDQAKKFPAKYRHRAPGEGHNPLQFRGLGDSPRQLSEGRRSQFPVFFSVSREMGSGERFAEDSIHRHTVQPLHSLALTRGEIPDLRGQSTSQVPPEKSKYPAASARVRAFLQPCGRRSGFAMKFAEIFY
jgi:hypothetical protein